MTQLHSPRMEVYHISNNKKITRDIWALPESEPCLAPQTNIPILQC